MDGRFLFRVGRCNVTHSEPEPCISLAAELVLSVCFCVDILGPDFVSYAEWDVSCQSDVPTLSMTANQLLINKEFATYIASIQNLSTAVVFSYERMERPEISRNSNGEVSVENLQIVDGRN